MSGSTLREKLDSAKRLALETGKVILGHMEGKIEVGCKEQDEVVTAADREANCVILGGLCMAFPADAIIPRKRQCIENKV